MNLPFWWAVGVRVVDNSGRAGELGMAGPRSDEYWTVRLDGEDGESSYVMNPDPETWGLEVKQSVTPQQLRRLVYDADRALVRAFGCHYVPEFEALPDSVRSGQSPCRVRLVGRPELDGARALIRGAVEAAFQAYLRDW